LILAAGLVFCGGFALGAAYFARLLRRREERVAQKINTLHYLRPKLAARGFPWLYLVDHLVEQDQAERPSATARHLQ
jgi:hypothetical protein